MSTTIRLGLPYIAVSQSGKETTHNQALSALDVLVQGSVLDKDLATPPSSPAEGDAYIVAGSPTGLWTGKAGYIVYRYGGVWNFITPKSGFSVMVTDEAKRYSWNGSAWSNATEFDGFSPMTTLGDMIYGGASGTGTRLAGNTAASKKFLGQTGNGTISAAPAWARITGGDVDITPAGNIASTTVAAAINELDAEKQPLDATLTALAALTIAASSLTIGTGADAFSQVSFAANEFPARASTGALTNKSISDDALSFVAAANNAAMRTALGGTTVGQAFFTLANPSAITFARINADNSVTARSAANFRSDLGLDTGDSPTFTAITTTGDATFGGNTVITGNLTVNGTTTHVNSTTVDFDDSLIKFSDGNTADVLDQGWYGQYKPAGTILYRGIFSDASDGKFKVFNSLQTEPTTTVDTGGTGYAIGTIVAHLEDSSTTITGGTINGTAIGGGTPAAGAFTTLSATAAVTLSPANANVVLSPTGTGVVTINPATAGTMNNVAIGGTTPAAVAATTLTMASGTAGAPCIAFASDTTTGLFLTAAGKMSATISGTERFRFIAGGMSGAFGTSTAFDPVEKIDLMGSGNVRIAIDAGGAADVRLTRSADSATAANFTSRKARGAPGAATVIIQNDLLGNYQFMGYDGAAYQEGAILMVQARAATPSATDMESEFIFACAPAASITRTNILSMRHSLGVSVFSNSVSASQLRLVSKNAAIVSGNVLGGIDALSNDTNLTAPGTVSGQVQFRASETHTGSALGTSFVVSLIPPGGSTTIADALTLTGAGNLSFLGSLTMADAKDIVLNTTTGTKIGTGTTQKLGFWNATPIVRGTAFTQTYSTASHSHAARTTAALTDNTTGSVSTTIATIAAITAASVDTTAAKLTDVQSMRTVILNALASLTDQVNKLRTDEENSAQVLNGLIDDLQAVGLTA